MYRKYVKRLLDIVLACLSLPFVMLIIIIFAPIIYFTDKGPVFYNSDRLGHECKKFQMFKLRTMSVNSPDIRNSDGSTYNSKFDPRVTAVGRFLRETSLDEFPQFINILKGDMSFIGPRPGLPDVWGDYDDNEKQRRSVKPGITGYSQAYYRNSDSMEKRMANDIFYSQHVSFALDCKILIKTICSVLKHENINRNIEEEV